MTASLVVGSIQIHRRAVRGKDAYAVLAPGQLHHLDGAVADIQPDGQDLLILC